MRRISKSVRRVSFIVLLGNGIERVLRIVRRGEDGGQINIEAGGAAHQRRRRRRSGQRVGETRAFHHHPPARDEPRGREQRRRVAVVAGQAAQIAFFFFVLCSFVVLGFLGVVFVLFLS